jgi:hypothetical protein
MYNGNLNMPRLKDHDHAAHVKSVEEVAENIATETAEVELEKLQKKIGREERKKRREIEAAKQKKATWLLPSLLLATMLMAWVLSRLDIP